MTRLTTSILRKAALGIGACGILAFWAPVGHTQSKPPADRQDAAVAYAQCIREKGYPEFPDPTPDGDLRFRITKDSVPRFEKAQEACRQLAPGGLADKLNSPDNIEALIQLAQCVRRSGFPAFPDPDSEGRLNFAGTGLDRDNARLQAAMKTCTRGGAAAVVGG